jgi:hypothetical protein
MLIVYPGRIFIHGRPDCHLAPKTAFIVVGRVKQDGSFYKPKPGQDYPGA